MYINKIKLGGIKDEVKKKVKKDGIRMRECVGNDDGGVDCKFSMCLGCSSTGVSS